MELEIREAGGLLIVSVRVQPRARRTAIQGVHDGALKVQLTAPPVEDRANRQLLDFLARLLELPPGNLTLSRGARSRLKRVRIRGLERAELQRRLTPYLV